MKFDGVLRDYLGTAFLTASLFSFAGCGESYVGIDSNTASKAENNLIGKDVIITGNITYKSFEPLEASVSNHKWLLRFEIQTSKDSQPANFSVLSGDEADFTKSKSGNYNGSGYIQGTFNQDSSGQGIITLAGFHEFHLNPKEGKK